MKRMVIELVAASLGVTTVGCSSSKDNAVLDALARAPQWEALMTVNICKEPPVSCFSWAPHGNADIDCYLRGSKELPESDGPTLRVLADQGYVTLSRLKLAGGQEKLSVELTAKGQQASIKPLQAGCGFGGIEIGAPSWAIRLAEPVDVRVVSVEAGQDMNMMTAHVKWRWKLTPAGDALRDVRSIGKAASTDARVEAELVKGAAGWSLAGLHAASGAW
jgi:hypothetical protein